MIIRKEHIGDYALLGIKKITGNRDELFQKLSIRQREEAQAGISNMRSERRVVEWLATRVLLSEMLDGEPIIENNSDGRPFLMDNSYHISISHTRDYVAVLLSKNYQVGIDIETISDRICRIKERFISEKEYIDDQNQVVHLLLHWSAKETIFKLLNENEVDFKEHLLVSSFMPKQKGTFEIYETKSKLSKTYTINYEILSDAVLTWAVDQ